MKEGSQYPQSIALPTQRSWKDSCIYPGQQPRAYPHKLRHTFASVAITAGADVASVSEALGHSDKAVTLRMYTHADAKSRKRAAQIFREAIKKPGKLPSQKKKKPA